MNLPLDGPLLFQRELNRAVDLLMPNHFPIWFLDRILTAQIEHAVEWFVHKEDLVIGPDDHDPFHHAREDRPKLILVGCDLQDLLFELLGRRLQIVGQSAKLTPRNKGGIAVQI